MKETSKHRTRGAASPTGSRRLSAFQKQTQALDLRLGGASWRKIADAVGYVDGSGAHKAVMAALEKLPIEAATKVRKMELERLDRLMMGMWPKAVNGDEKASNQCLQIMIARARYLGLFAPQNVKIGMNPVELFFANLPADIADALRANLARSIPGGNSPIPPEGDRAEALSPIPQ